MIEDGSRERRSKSQRQPPAISQQVRLIQSDKSRAAALIGTGGLVPFGGFGASQVESFGDLKPTLVVILRKLSKRDETTKVKAFEELCDELSVATVDDFQAFVPHWPAIYKALSIDTDKRVRVLCNTAFILVAESLKKEFAPYLKELMGAWLICMYDPVGDVAEISSQNFAVNLSHGLTFRNYSRKRSKAKCSLFAWMTFYYIVRIICLSNFRKQ